MITRLLVVLLALSDVHVMAQEPATPSSRPFTSRVAAFWKDFGEHATELHEMVGREDARNEVLRYIQPRLDALIPEVAWSFSQGKTKDVHALILSPEGNFDHWLLLGEWLERAPTLKGWEFHVGTPPIDVDGFQLGIGGATLAIDACRFALTVDTKAKKLDLKVWHPGFGELPADVREQAAWLAASNVLGELWTFVWLGELEIGRGTAPPTAVSSKQLPATFEGALRRNEWDPSAKADQNWSLYRGRAEDPPSFPRADIISGATLHPELVIDHLESRGKCKDRLAGTGACHAWIAIPTSCFDLDEVVDQRAAIEAAIEENLDCGRVLGGATGRQEVCIDVLLFDEARAVGQLRRVLAGQARVRGAQLRRFAGGDKPVKFD